MVMYVSFLSKVDGYHKTLQILLYRDLCLSPVQSWWISPDTSDSSMLLGLTDSCPKLIVINRHFRFFHVLRFVYLLSRVDGYLQTLQILPCIKVCLFPAQSWWLSPKTLQILPCIEDCLYPAQKEWPSLDTKILPCSEVWLSPAQSRWLSPNTTDSSMYWGLSVSCPKGMVISGH